MPFTMPNFEQISPEGASPLIAALNYANKNRALAAEIQKQQLANQLAQMQLPYAEEDIKTTLEKRRQDIKLEKFKNEHPDLFYPEDVQIMSWLKNNAKNLFMPTSQAQPQAQENAPTMGNMTLLSGADFSPQKQLATGLATTANAPTGATQGLDLNNPLIHYAAKYNPALKQQIDLALAEQAGQTKGIVSQGEKSGEYRATDIHDLDTQYGQLLQSGASIDHLVDLAKDPAFMNMKNKIPFFQDKQLQVLAKIGTPEEQQKIGDFLTSIGSSVASAVQTFKGSALEKEFDLENQMNVQPSDTWNTMVGKLTSLKTYKELIKRRNRVAAKLMQEKHMNKGDALEQADKQVDGNKIRKQIEYELKPKIKIRNKKTGEEKYITADEARAMGVENV